MKGTDNLPTSIGHGWQEGPINSPTGLSASFNLPQFWDGRAADLTEAVNIMAWAQLNRRFFEQGNAKIVVFVKTLTGKQPSFTLPQLPPSGPDTPKPQPFE